MTIVQVKIGKKKLYSVNGFHITREAMEAIGKEIFTESGWATIAKTVATLGYANCTLHSDGVKPDEVKNQLADANQRIVALERQMAELLRR